MTQSDSTRFTDLPIRTSVIGLMLAAPAAAVAQTHIPVPLTIPSPGSVQYGLSLAMDGDQFITGPGAVQVYLTQGTATPILQQTLGGTGFDVALSGNYAVATFPSDGEGIDPASAYIQERTAGTWTYIQDTGDQSDLFEYGRAAVFHGDRLLVSETRLGPGRVHQYQRDSQTGTWNSYTFQPFLIPHNGWASSGSGSNFGYDMDVWGDRLVVTQPFGTHGANVYTWNGTQWAFEVELGTSGVGNNVGNVEGSQVDIDGNLIVVGAPNHASPSWGQGTGVVYVYEHDGTQWTGPAVLEAFDGCCTGSFGAGVAVNAATGRIAVGAPMWSHFPDNIGSIGAGYIFHRVSQGNWTLSERLEPEITTFAGRRFGQVVGMNDEVALFGTRGWGYSMHAPMPPNMFAAPFSPTLCHGDGGDQAGCVDCPCGNNAAQGTRGGCLNAFGRSARLVAERSIAVQDDALIFRLEGAGPGAFTLLISGTTVPGTLGCAPSSGRAAVSIADGLRCVGGGMRRHGIRLADGEGEVTAEAPWAHVISQSGFQAGERRVFQAVYRDGPTAPPCGTGLNSTNAIEITFLP